MINTVSIKKEQLEKGYFSSGTGKEIILIMGSCRVAPIVNYFEQWNKYDNRFTICSIDPFNWNWNEKDERIDYETKLLELETYQPLLDMLKSVDIFIHEYYANAEMFNVDKDSFKNIYQFGLNPGTDICLPNFNDIFILTADIVRFNSDIRKKALQDLNVLNKLSPQTIKDIEKEREFNLNKFYRICAKTSFPDFAEHFMLRYKKIRYFFTHNHISKNFTWTLFAFITNELNIFPSPEFLRQIYEYDMFDNHRTPLTEYDNGYTWDEEIKPLKDIL